MPLIEELPITGPIRASHGWAYVPDTGPIAAQQPGTRSDRKRAAGPASRNAAASTIKREKAVQQRLESLNRENYKDGVTVPVPSNREREREKGGKKMTSNVRRILAYQRNFAHYLADVEANHPGAVHYQLPHVSSGVNLPPALAKEESRQRSASKDTNVSRRSGARRSVPTQPARPSTPTEIPRGAKRGRPGLRSKPNTGESSPVTTPVKEEQAGEPEEKDMTVTDVPTTDTSPPTTSRRQSLSPQSQLPSYPPAWDTEPLLSSTPADVPPMPSARVMHLLISEPPLTYNAARATPLDDETRPPPRHFCGICGYWGRVKCKKCEEWTCGIMECWRGHEATCAMANMY